jgi:hypothetical protein
MFSQAQMASRIRRRRSRLAASSSSDPKSLTPEVCPFVGTLALQISSWINEKIPPITFLFSVNDKRVFRGCRYADARQAAFLCRRDNGDAGK